MPTMHLTLPYSRNCIHMVDAPTKLMDAGWILLVEKLSTFTAVHEKRVKMATSTRPVQMLRPSRNVPREACKDGHQHKVSPMLRPSSDCSACQKDGPIDAIVSQTIYCLPDLVMRFVQQLCYTVPATRLHLLLLSPVPRCLYEQHCRRSVNQLNLNTFLTL